MRCHTLLLLSSYTFNIKCRHYIFIISQLCLTFHPRRSVVLLDTGIPGTSIEIYIEDADGETRNRNPTKGSSHWAKQLKSCCWEGAEFIQLVYCIIMYLSFLNCGWLLIREVQWFYWIMNSWYQQRHLQWGCRWYIPMGIPAWIPPALLLILECEFLSKEFPHLLFQFHPLYASDPQLNHQF